MLAFLKDPEKNAVTFGSGRKMPNLGITDEEAKGLVAFLKWMSAIDTNGFPHQFQDPRPQRSADHDDCRQSSITPDLNGGQKLAVKYFTVAMVLFVAQMLFGLLAGIQFIGPSFSMAYWTSASTAWCTSTPWWCGCCTASSARCTGFWRRKAAPRSRR